MSGRALRLAVKQEIQERLLLSDAEIDVTDGPEPHPSAPQIFVAVHPGPWLELSSYEGNYSDHDYSVKVTTSVRSGHVPNDRWGKEVINASSDGLEMWALEIIAIIHNNWELVTVTANGILQSNTDEFAEPLRFRPSAEPKRQYGAWWTAGMEHQQSKTQNPHNTKPAGFSQTLLFAGARRTRLTEEQGWP